MSAQNNMSNLFDKLDRSDMQTSILFNNLISFSELAKESTNIFNTNGFFQAYNELAQGDSKNRFKAFQALLKAQKESYFNNIIPIGIVYSEFDVINDSAIQNEEIKFLGSQFVKSPTATASIFEIKHKLFAAPFRSKIKGLSAIFNISDEFFLNTSDINISSIKIDFDDGMGLRKVNIGDIVNVLYPTEGVKNMTFEITLNTDESLFSYSSILVQPNIAEHNNRNTAGGAIIPFTSTITPDLSAYGEAVSYPGEGEYQIFLDTDNGILDKPVIVVDGFDPGDGRTIAGLYSAFDYTDAMGPQNLADFVRSQGHDVIILNFPTYTRAADSEVIDGGADFIERNAMLLVDLIGIINASKTGSEQNVIIGPSMGGLVTRYALNYMENQTLAHDTRLFLSFDSPHRGANVPLGVQHQLNYLAFGLGANNVVELQAVVNGMLKSPAARQMLVDHLEPHLDGTDPPVEFDPLLLLPAQHPWKTILDTNINALTTNGFPQTIRNVAIINGSGIGNPYQDKMGGDISPGFTFLNTTINVDMSGFVTADLTMNFTPATASGSQLVSSVVINLFGSPIQASSANAQAFSFSDGIDAASGGLFNMTALGGSMPPPGPVADFFAAIQSDFFNFIPAISAIALEITPNGEIDWYHNIDIGTGSPPSEAPPRDVVNSTPFVNWYMPDNNEEHITITEENVIFALTEIIPGTLNLGSLDITSIRLEKNPIQNELNILTQTPLNGASIAMYDISGRLVYNIDLGNTSEQISIPIQLNSGLYIVKLSSDSGVFTTKVVVE